MSITDTLAYIQTQIGHSLSLVGENHLPLEERLQHLMLPDEDKRAKYLVVKEELIALNLSDLGLKEEQLNFLTHKGCQTLQALSLSHNQFAYIELPATLQKLQYLFLNDNEKLKTLAISAGLQRLKRLNISKCGLSDLTLSGGFDSLEFLYLSDNKELATFKATGPFPKLKHLYLSSCKLSELKLGDHFPALISLLINGNQLKQSPAIEGDIFPVLENLDLSNNQIKRLEADFLNPFPALLNLRLTENPLPETILSNIGSSPAKDLGFIQRYTQELFQASEMDNECKVLLIGNGNVGKSCLVARLVSNRFEAEWKSTHGIVLEQYPQTSQKDPLLNPYILNLWDFGGQDIYHATHRLFMQAGAVYLVLWDWKTEESPTTSITEKGKLRHYDNYPLTYWLSYAKSLGKNSPTIVVQTKVERDGEKLLPKIRDAFQPMAFHHIESAIEDKDENGYNQLLLSVKRGVKKVKTQQQIPTSWANVRKQMRKWQLAQKKRLSLVDFFDLSKKYEYEAPMDILNWLTQSGVVFYQKGLFNNEIILDQAWAIDAVYTLFERNTFYYEAKGNKGAFHGEDLVEVWEKNSEAERELFVSFMLSCEMCFETTAKEKARYHIPFKERTFVIPQLLPEQKPHEVDDFWYGRQVLFMRYEHAFLHPGVIQRFIVRTHFLAKNLGETRSIWRSGIQLKENEAFALIEVGGKGKTIEVKVTQGGKVLLDKIRNELDELQDQIGKVFVSVDGQNYADIIKLEDRTKDEGSHEIECTNGVYCPVEDFLPFLNRDQGQRFKNRHKDPMIHFHTERGSLSVVKTIKQFIAENQWKEAIDRMLQLASPSLENQIYQLQGSFNRLQEQRGRGTLSQENIYLQFNQLTEQALEVCNQLAHPQLENQEHLLMESFPELAKKTRLQVPEVSPEIVLPKTPKSKIQAAKVYFSYAWGDLTAGERNQELIVDRLFDSLSKSGFNVVRDKMTLEYGAFISQFMEELGQGKLIVVFVSDKYVRSPYCMFELFEIARNNKWNKEAFRKHVLPIRLESLAFDKPETLGKYFGFWKEEERKWSEFVRDNMDLCSPAQYRRFQLVKEIKQQLGRLSEWIQDINASSLNLLSENDFELVKKKITERLSIK